MSSPSTTAVFMVMGANIGTSVTNTIVAMGHFANMPTTSAADSPPPPFTTSSTCSPSIVFLPINWIYPWLEKMTYEMVKDQKPCEDVCDQAEFLKPYIDPYSKGVANYDKKVAGYVSQGYCAASAASNTPPPR